MGKNLEGSIFKTRNCRRWVTRIQFRDSTGRLRSVQQTVESAALARVALRDLRDSLRLSDRRQITYRELDSFFRAEYVHSARFVGGKKISGFRQDIKSIQRYLDRALEFFSDRLIESISYADLRDYKKVITSVPTVHGRQRSVSEINHHLKRLRRLFTVAVEQGWIAVNPFTRGGPLVIESFEAERTRIVSVAEEIRLLAACNRWRSHLKPIIIFAVETALRRGEITALRWSDVNLEKRFLTVESTNSKTLRSRLVPISERAAQTLNDIHRQTSRNLNGFVFGQAEFKNSFNSACAAAGIIDLHFHDLRHTAITRWLEKGVSPALAMKASGHSQMKTFLRYVNQTEDSVFEFAQKISRAA